jgi:hypothetical protein
LLLLFLPTVLGLGATVDVLVSARDAVRKRDLLERLGVGTRLTAWQYVLLDGTVPVAGPGIGSTLGPDEIVVYRTSRSRPEVLAVLAAVAAGRPGEAFRASTAFAPGLVNHDSSYMARMRASVRRGEVPLFTSPYASVAYFYTRWDKGAPDFDPCMWALVVPRDAVIWTSPRVHNPNGVLHSITWSDSELVVDARRVRRVLVVDPDHAARIAAGTELLAVRDLKKVGSFKGAYRDADPELARAARDAVADLRVPPTALQRPFLEIPLPTPIGGVLRGQKVLLLDGQTVELVGHRVSGRGHLFQVRGLKPWGSHGILDPVNLPSGAILRVVAPGERLTASDRRETWLSGRASLGAMLDAEEARLRALSVGADDSWADRIREDLEGIDADRRLLSSDVPPWSRR